MQPLANLEPAEIPKSTTHVPVPAIFWLLHLPGRIIAAIALARDAINVQADQQEMKTRRSNLRICAASVRARIACLPERVGDPSLFWAGPPSARAGSRETAHARNRSQKQLDRLKAQRISLITTSTTTTTTRPTARPRLPDRLLTCSCISFFGCCTGYQCTTRALVQYERCACAQVFFSFVRRTCSVGSSVHCRHGPGRAISLQRGLRQS